MSKTTIDRDTLTEATRKVSRITERKNTMPILSHMRLQLPKSGKGHIMATDIETSIIYPIEGTCARELDICLPAHLTLQVLQNAQGFEKEAEIDVLEGNFVSINHAQLASLPAAEYPVLPEATDAQSFVFEGLPEAIARVLCACGDSDTRYMLNGLYFDFPGKRIAGTDGHRLHIVKYPFPEASIQVVIPKKILTMISGDEIKAKFNEKNAFFDNGEYTLITRFFDGTYPNVDNVIPKESSIRFKMNKQSLMDLCIETLPLTRAGVGAARFIVKPDSLTIETNNPDTGENKATIDATLTGDTDFPCGFNLRFIIDVLKAFESPDITFEMNDSISPCKMEEKGFMAIVMPMRI